MIKKIFTIFILFYVSCASIAQGYDPLQGFSTQLGDFASRSSIMGGMSNKKDMTIEQKEILREKKLIPNTECLIKQIKKGNIENADLLLQAGVNPNQSYYSDYPVYIATRNKQAEIARLLLSYGAKLDRGFYSELYEAVKNKDDDLAMFFINNNAKVNYQDAVTNNTILSMALKNKMYDIAKILIQKGAKADNVSAKIIKKKKLQWLVEEAKAGK